MDFLLATHSIKRIFYLALLVIICFVIYHHSNDLVRYWVVWSAFFLSLIIWEETLKLRIKMIVQTGLAFIIITGLFGLLTHTPILVPLGLCALIVAGLIFAEKRVQYYLSVFVIILLAIISGLSSSSFMENNHRILMLAIGVLIFLACQLLFYLRPLRTMLRIDVYVALKKLLDLNQSIFTCLIDPSYKDNLYLFERRIHVNKQKCMHAFWAFGKHQSSDRELLSQLNLLYDSLLDCGMLRFRIKDPSILKICETEMVGIFYAINQVMKGYMKVYSRTWLIPKVNSQQHLDQLSQWILKLEENYQHFLEAVAADPLAFLLFIDSVKSFARELSAFSGYKLKL